jgi:hypothetical protein
LRTLSYFLLTGQSPFAGRSPVQVLAAHMYEQAAPLTARRVDMSIELENVDDVLIGNDENIYVVE